jgi:hypothetical protein
MVWCLALVLYLASLQACSSTQWAKTKAHAVESGASGLGGAAAVVVGGPAGFLVFIVCATVGVIVNEQIQPPDKVLVITIDGGGKILKTERFQPTETQGAPKPERRGMLTMFADFSWTAVKWILFFVALNVVFKFAFGERYRTLVREFLLNLMSALKNIATLQVGAATSDLASAAKSAHRASGMGHSVRGQAAAKDPPKAG